jgi:hypothetical protein
MCDPRGDCASTGAAEPSDRCLADVVRHVRKLDRMLADRWTCRATRMFHEQTCSQLLAFSVDLLLAPLAPIDKLGRGDAIQFRRTHV